MTVKYHQMGRIDIHRGDHVVSTFLGEQPILSKHRGGEWTVAEGVDLGDLILAASALLDLETETRGK